MHDGYIIGKIRDRPQYSRLTTSILEFLDSLPGQQNRHDLQQDVHQTANQHTLALGGRPGRLLFGRLITALPRVNWYRVMIDELDGDFPCCTLSPTGVLPTGAIQYGMYPPNSMVLVFKLDNVNHGYILGAAPEVVQDGNQTFGDWISQGSATGLAREGYYNEIFSLMERDGGVSDFSADRPLDQSCLDHGVITELGGRWHIDPFLIQLMHDEMCGLQLFYHDQLARLCGYNLDIRSAMHSLSIRLDDGECQLHRGETLYPWEISGAFADGETVHREIDDKDVLYDQPYGKLEPAHDDQLPFFRYQEYGGYLGQGHIRQMCLPPTEGEGPLRLSTDTLLPGVFREQILPTGAYTLQSAKSIIIAKRAPIAVPVLKTLPEDYRPEDSDNASNYKASGTYGEGDDHKVSDLQPEGELDNLLSVAGVMDLHAYTFNWQGVHPFHYHAKDYRLPDEADLPLDKVQVDPDFSELANQQWLSRPTPVQLKVDDRYGNVNYFKVLSHLSFLDDGGVVLLGGGGCAITLAGGSVEISAPGDVWFRSGRSILQWAGDDIVLKAQNSIDVTTSKKDVRIKAEVNLELLGGNGGTGSVLIESKASGATYEYEGHYGEDVQGSGVVIKSNAGQFAVLAAGVYLRTGSSDGEIGSGKIVLDADKGQADIITICSKWDQYVDNKITTTFGVEQPRAVNKFQSDKAVFGMRVDVNGQMAVNGNGMFIAGNVDATGDFAGNGLASAFGKVGYLSTNPASLNQVRSRLADVGSAADSDVESASSSYQQFTSEYYADGRIGNASVERALSVTLRIPEQYGTSDFRLPESPWQQMAKATGQFQTWTETVVNVGGRELMPYPGTEKWRDEETFLQLDTGIYDSTEGRDKARSDEIYEDPVYQDWVPTSLDGHYPVTK